MDLLDLYTHHKQSTIVGPETPLDTFINVRITLNQEASASSLSRYTEWKEVQPTSANGVKPANNGLSPQSPRQATTSLISANATASSSPATTAGKRGLEGTVRFMLDAGRAREEKAVVRRYYTTEEEEYEEEVEVERPKRSR